MPDITLFKDLDSLSFYAAQLLFKRIKQRIDTGREANIILAGGNTPKLCYAKLAKLINNFGMESDALKKLYWYPGDERWVPSAHPDSNEGMIREYLFGELNPVSAVPEENAVSINFFKWKTNTDTNSHKVTPLESADRYNTLLDNRFYKRGIRPDIAVLGMGSDGHTASLFPDGEFILSDSAEGLTQCPGNHPALKSLKKNRAFCCRVAPQLNRNASAVYRQKLNIWRLSMTASFLNSAELVVFLINGKDKHNAFIKLLNGTNSLPVSWIKGKETLYLITESINPPPITRSSL